MRIRGYRIHDRIAGAAGLIVIGFAGVLLLNVARAAEWKEPTAIPPAGNPPGFVWTLDPGGAAQIGGQFNIGGGGTIHGFFQALGMSAFGDPLLDLGVGTVGQNLIYGSAYYDLVHPTGDALLLLQTAQETGMDFAMTDRLRVDREGNLTVSGKVRAPEVCIGASCQASWPSGTITEVRAGANLTGGGAAGAVTLGLVENPVVAKLSVSGDADVGGGFTAGSITAKGCLGAVLRGKSVTASSGNVGGYVAANGKCPSGQHVCTTSEVLQSIACGAFATAGVASGADMWIANLAPSLPTPTNDCIGWTSNSGDYRGIKWRLNTTTGGAAYAESCTAVLPFSCCG